MYYNGSAAATGASFSSDDFYYVMNGSWDEQQIANEIMYGSSSSSSGSSSSSSNNWLFQDQITKIVLQPVLASIFVTVVSLLIFGWLIHKEYNDELTPRASNLPKRALKNALLHFTSHPRIRHNWCLHTLASFYPIAYLLWSYNLTYKQCLEGIPGTGTRNDGWDGPPLKVNLDGIVLLKFHTLLFKISVVVGALCTFVLLPIYATAGCGTQDLETFGIGTCLPVVNTTSLAKTTILHIPAKEFSNNCNMTGNEQYINSTVFSEVFNNIIGVSGDVLSGQISMDYYNKYNSGDDDDVSNLVLKCADDATNTPLIQYSMASQVWVPNQTWRVMATVICCLIIYVYTFYLLTWEWMENLALRRICFLEAGHYEQRKQELNQFAMDAAVRNNFNCEHSTTTMKYDDEAAIYNTNKKKKKKGFPPWKTNPEIRETPPSIGLYSVMFQLPKSMITYDTDGATTIERQLVATTKFFDEIVPPEQGFSSSVAAVTMTPKAALVAKVWMKWIACENKLQTLRHVRKLIVKLEKEQEEGRTHHHLCGVSTDMLTLPFHHEKENDNNNNNNNEDEEIGNTSSDDNNTSENENDPYHTTNNGSTMTDTNRNDNNNHNQSSTTTSIWTEDIIIERNIDVESIEFSNVAKSTTGKQQIDASRFSYEHFDVMEYAKSIGFREEIENMTEFIDGMGIEEFSVFAYQCALIAGGPGCCKRVNDFYCLDTLKEEEKDMLEALKDTNEELIEARAYLIAEHDDFELPSHRHDIVHSLNNSRREISICMTNSSGAGGFDDECEASEAGSYIRFQNMTDASSNKTGSSLRQRRRGVGTAHSVHSLSQYESDWDLAQREALAMMAVQESKIHDTLPDSGKDLLTAFLRRVWSGFEPTVTTPKYYGMKTENDGSKGFVTNLKHPSYAVVTFTSRYSAIIARQCLADGGAINSWKQVDDIPVFPLADAPPMMCFPRGCPRPVSPTITYFGKRVRRWIIYTVIVIMTCFFTVPISLINDYILKPELWVVVLNGINVNIDKGVLTSWLSTISGFSQTLLFSVCPTIFKFLANCEGSSSSMEKAEQQAMIFFWYFYIIARFLGPIALLSVKGYLEGGGTLEQVITGALSELGRQAPMVLGPSAITYIIFAGGVTWPTMYLLQAPNFCTKTARLKLFNRMLKGGGPGAETPYRIYVDSGYIFACLTALAPVCPLVGTLGLFYFIAISPMIRWLLVFAYRPKFDGGGNKWPKLHHIIISSMLFGQLITSMTLLLKQNLYEGLFIGFMIVPTFLYNSIILDKFQRPYQDAALLQIGRMHNSSCQNSWMEREETRRWLVDCHKASYVPSCLSGGGKNLVTAEPATTITTIEDSDGNDEYSTSYRSLLQRQETQRGGILRRQQYNI